MDKNEVLMSVLITMLLCGLIGLLITKVSNTSRYVACLEALKAGHEVVCIQPGVEAPR